MTEEQRLRVAALLRGTVLFDEPMAAHTSLKVGGPADCYAIPADLDDLRSLTSFLSGNGIACLVVGSGSNLLIGDGGFRGAVISLRELRGIDIAGACRLEAEAGVDNRSLVRRAAELGLGGLEFLVGIPGTLGGALAMNAGAGGEAVIDRLEILHTLVDGTLISRVKKDLVYGYRYLQLAPGEIILGASFGLFPEERAVIVERVETFLEHRRKAQQVGFPNAGSFFKNPPGKAAWRLIEEAGLRGYRIGGAQVSEVHTNFLVNRGGARAADFVELAGKIKAEVKEKTGVLLEEEVKIVGE